MKILHFLGRFDLPAEPGERGAGGTTRVALELARVQRRLGHDVWVATTARESWQSEWQGVKLRGLAQAGWARLRSRDGIMDWRVHLPLLQLTRAEEFDVVHGHEYPYLRFVPARLRLAHIHNNPFWTQSLPNRWRSQKGEFRTLQAHSEGRIAVSEFIARQLRLGMEAVGIWPHRNLDGGGDAHVVWNGVDPARFECGRWSHARKAVRDRHGIAEEDVVFLYAGAVAPIKGVLSLAQAFADLATHLPNVRLLLAGSAKLWGNSFESARSRDSEYERHVHEELRQLIAAQRVIPLGVVAAREMPEVYAACDVFVLPSQEEACPLVILEALSAGRPIIASNVGGIPELTSPANSILVPPENPQALAGAMRTLAEEPLLRGELASNAASAAGQMTWERSVERLEAVYAHYLPPLD